MGNQNQQPRPETEMIAFDLERFSGLSCEMVALLETLTQDYNRSAQELRNIRAVVDAGKAELAALREIEREASVLKAQLEDLRLQKKGFENLIADQRNAWEEEKTKQDLEEREREENLKALRQREENEYRRMREIEQMQTRQKYEAELAAMRQKSAEIRTTEEMGILARELALKKKEQELSRLMQELEKFLSGLAGRKGIAAYALTCFNLDD